MAKPRSRELDYLVYLLLRVLICVIQALPFPLALWLADGFAWLAYRVDRRHRKVAEENLQHAFPEQSSITEQTAIVRSVYRHFLTMLIEILFLPRILHTTNWHRHLKLRGGKRIVSALLSGRPLWLVTAHFGNWEIGGYVLGLFGFTTHAIARPLDNRYLDDFLRSFRERTGQRLLAKKGDFEHMEEILAHGGVIATLGDQDAGRKGLFVDFFHRPASTHKVIALLALEYNVPILVIGVPRVGKGLHYEVRGEALICPEDYQGRPDAVLAMTQRFTDVLESMIREIPEQYFWLHRRWKHQPKARQERKTA